MTSNKTARKSPAPARLSVAWPPFTEKLAQALSMLEEDQFLIISVKNSNRYVQFSAQGSFGMRAETTSNSYLSISHAHQIQHSRQFDNYDFAKITPDQKCSAFICGSRCPTGPKKVAPSFGHYNACSFEQGVHRVDHGLAGLECRKSLLAPQSNPRLNAHGLVKRLKQIFVFCQFRREQASE